MSRRRQTDHVAQIPTDSAQTADIGIAAYPTSVIIRGQELGSATYYYHNGVNGAMGTVTDVARGANAHYDPDTRILTLTGLNVVNCDAELGGIRNAIFISSNGSADVTIVLNGNNSVSTSDSNGEFNYGLFAAGSLTVSGEGSLTAISGTATGTGVAPCNYGVYVSGTITANDGTLSGIGRTSASRYGVRSTRGDINANGSGSITGVGGVASSNSCGVSANTRITIANGATTLAQGHTKALNKESELNGGTAAASTSYDDPNPGAYNPAGWASYRLFRTPEVIPAPQLTITQSSFVRGKAPANETVTVSAALAGFNATNNFLRATMDGAAIDLGTMLASGTDGWVENGSIVIHLNPTYLNSLSAGAHTLRVYLAGVYTGQSVETTITVTDGSSYVSGNPATGDTASIALWTAVAIVTAGVLVIALKKRRV